MLAPQGSAPATWKVDKLITKRMLDPEPSSLGLDFSTKNIIRQQTDGFNILRLPVQGSAPAAYKADKLITERMLDPEPSSLAVNFSTKNTIGHQREGFDFDLSGLHPGVYTVTTKSSAHKVYKQ